MVRNSMPTFDEVLVCTAHVPEHVVYRPFAKETGVLNLRTGKYHGLNPTAGAMLVELERGGTFAEAAPPLAELYKRPAEEIERDAYELCLDLLERGLIELAHPDGRLETGRSNASGCARHP